MPGRRRSPQNTGKQVTPRVARGRFAPGVCPNPGGRPKDIAEVRELARTHTSAALDTLVQIARDGKSENARIAASSALLDRGWGRPTQPLSGDDDMPPLGPALHLTIETVEERKARVAQLVADAFAEYSPGNSNTANGGGELGARILNDDTLLPVLPCSYP